MQADSAHAFGSGIVARALHSAGRSRRMHTDAGDDPGPGCTGDPGTDRVLPDAFAPAASRSPLSRVRAGARSFA